MTMSNFICFCYWWCSWWLSIFFCLFFGEAGTVWFFCLFFGEAGTVGVFWWVLPLSVYSARTSTKPEVWFCKLKHDIDLKQTKIAKIFYFAEKCNKLHENCSEHVSVTVFGSGVSMRVTAISLLAVWSTDYQYFATFFLFFFVFFLCLLFSFLVKTHTIFTPRGDEW